MAPGNRLRIFQTYSVLHRNDGPPLYWNQAFKSLDGISHLHLDGLYPLHEFGVPDAWCVVDWGEDGLTALLPKTPKDWEDDGAVRIYVCSDTHYSEDAYQHRLAKAKQATLTLCNQSAAAERMKADGAIVGYLPHAVDPTAYPAAPLAIPKYDVCFVGHINHPSRAELLDVVFKAFPNFWFGQRFFEPCAEIYRKSKIVLNQALNDDLNMRVFEALATKSFLLTPAVTDLPRWFTDGVHLATYTTPEDAVEKAHYYLAHEREREQIAEAGYQEVMAKHTYRHRAETVIATIRALMGTQRTEPEAIVSA